MLLRNKKGVDLMIGYVLLIVIALALAAAVFFYLKLYLPSDKPTCSNDVDISIDEVVCSGGRVFVNVTNRGLFTVDGAFIKIGDPSRVFKTTLNPDSSTGWTDTDPKCPVGPLGNNLKLLPGEKFCGNYDHTPPAPLLPAYEVSVEPLIYVDGQPIICTEAVIKKNVVCS